jgi:hypothetical protein
LTRMYSLLSRVNSGLNPMCEVFKTHIISLGAELIQRRGAKLETIPEKERERDVPGGAYDPQFIKDILTLHSKYGGLVSTSFGGNGLFQRSLKDAFTDIVNRELTGSPVTFADVLATYADRMLRSGSTEKLSDAEIEAALSQVRLRYVICMYDMCVCMYAHICMYMYVCTHIYSVYVCYSHIDSVICCVLCRLWTYSAILPTRIYSQRYTGTSFMLSRLTNLAYLMYAYTYIHIYIYM